MLDKLDVEVPTALAKWNPEFKRHWDNPQNDRLFKKHEGSGLYLVTADLRDAGIPIRLSLGHKHHDKLGPKVEIIGVGEMGYSDWVGRIEEVFDVDGNEAELLRVDLTADIPGVTVSEIGRTMYCKFKATTQQEYGQGDDQGESSIHLSTTHNRFAAQTLYYGRKPRQVRIYDKTRHRAEVILREVHRKQRRAGEELCSFEQYFGYDQSETITRVERQMGARESSEAWGISKVGEIHKLEKCDPFARLKFIDEVKRGDTLAKITGPRRVAIDYLREMVEREGVDRMRAYLRSRYRSDQSRAYRKFMQENEHLILAGTAVSRAKLTSEYRDSLRKQLAA